MSRMFDQMEQRMAKRMVELIKETSTKKGVEGSDSSGRPRWMDPSSEDKSDSDNVN